MSYIGNSLAQGLISGANIEDGSIDTPDLKDGAVTTAKLGTVTQLKSNITNLVFKTGASDTTAVTIDTSQNVGVGVTPSAWSGSKALQLLSTVIYNNTNNNSFFGANYYYNGTDNKYINTAAAAAYGQVDGSHRWFSAASGTAGATVIFTQAMTLSNSSSNTTLEVAGQNVINNTVMLRLNNVYYNNWDLINDSNLRFVRGSSEYARITSDGNFGIGTTSPSSKFEVKLTTNDYGYFSNTGDNNTGVRLQNTGRSYGIFVDGGSGASNGLRFYDFTAGADRMRLSSGGEFSIGKTQASESAQTGSGYGFASPSFDPFFSIVNANASGGNACIYLNRRTTGTLIAFGTNNGTGFTTVGSITHNGSNTAYNTASDYRLKDSVAPMTGALAKVVLLKPCTYTWKSTGANGQGFIAHELQEVFPDAVVGEKDALDKNGDIAPQSIDTSFLVATLTAAIQEQQAIITSLTTRITALEGVN